MVHCAWGDCANDDKYNKPGCKRPRKEFVETWWVSWPKDIDLRQQWVKACGRADFTNVSDVGRCETVSRFV